MDMVKSSHGSRSGTRNKLKQRPDMRPPITKFLQEFKDGERVLLMPEPSSHKGMPPCRWKGVAGTITGKRGRAYFVEIRDGNAKKTFIVRPEHLKRD